MGVIFSNGMYVGVQPNNGGNPTPSVTPTQTPSVTPTSSEIPVTPTQTITPTPSITETATPTPTPTDAPAVSPTPTPTGTPASTPNATPTPTMTPSLSVSGATFSGYSYGLACGPGPMVNGSVFLFSDNIGTITYNPADAVTGYIAFSAFDESNVDHTSFYSALTGNTTLKISQGGNSVTFAVSAGAFVYQSGGGQNMFLYDGTAGSSNLVVTSQVGSAFTCGQSLTISLPVTPGGGGSGGGAGQGAWYFYSDEGSLNAGPPNGNGNAIFIDNNTNTETFNPNKSAGVDILYFDAKDSNGTDFTSQFSAYTGGTGSITISQNGDTATYSGTTSGSFAIVTFGGNNIFTINTGTCTQTKESSAKFTYADPISITFS